MASETRKLTDHWQEFGCDRWLSVPTPRAFDNEPIGLNAPNITQIEPRTKAVVHRDNSSRITLELRRGDHGVICIPQLPHGLYVETIDHVNFDMTYTPLLDYPPGRCAVLMARFATQVGGTHEAMAELGKLVEVTADQTEEAASRLSSNKAKIRQPELPLKVKRGERVEAPKTKRRKRNSAAEMFRTLIIEGKLSDDEIFAKVQEVFGLSDFARSRVSVYRSQLRKEGKVELKAKKKTRKTAKKKIKKKLGAYTVKRKKR